MPENIMCLRCLEGRWHVCDVGHIYLELTELLAFQIGELSDIVSTW